MNPDDRPKWHIYRINADGTFGRDLSEGLAMRGHDAEDALTAAANGVQAALFDCGQLYLVSRNTDYRGLNVYGARILRLTVPPRPSRVAEAVTF